MRPLWTQKGGHKMHQQDENKRRERRIELANNLTLVAVAITAIVNTVGLIVKIKGG